MNVTFFFVPSQVKEDLEHFAQHGVSLVFICELNKAHHAGVELPTKDWRKIGCDEFLIATAPGWKLDRQDSGELRYVFPHTTDKKKRWRKYYQAGGGGGGVHVRER